ncbi:MAG: hypothetical protein AAF280_12780, partial [Pseudomonadota bacterium]
MTQTRQFTPQSALMLVTLASLWGGSCLFCELVLGAHWPVTHTVIRVLLAVPGLCAWLFQRRNP